MLHFDLNISILLKDRPFLDRIDEAARLQFDTVEFWWPAEVAPAQLAARVKAAGLHVALFNLDAGDMAAGDRGLLNDPARRERLRAHVPVALELAAQLGCTRLNALAGHWRPGVPRADQLAFVRENLAWIAGEARKSGVTIMLEAINRFENGDYLFTTASDTLAFIDSVGADNVRFQFDAYHLQRMEGNLTALLRQHVARIGHIQVADSPARHQPGTGEINYPFLFGEIVRSGYQGFVGLEYSPLGSVPESLAWLPEDRRALVPLSALRFSAARGA